MDLCFNNIVCDIFLLQIVEWALVLTPIMNTYLKHTSSLGKSPTWTDSIKFVLLSKLYSNYMNR